MNVVSYETENIDTSTELVQFEWLPVTVCTGAREVQKDLLRKHTVNGSRKEIRFKNRCQPDHCNIIALIHQIFDQTNSQVPSSANETTMRVYRTGITGEPPHTAEQV